MEVEKRWILSSQTKKALLPCHLAALKEHCGAPSSNPTGFPTGGQEATQHAPLCPGQVSLQPCWPAKLNPICHSIFWGHTDPGAAKFFPVTT